MGRPGSAGVLRPVVLPALAVLGGWLMVLPGSVVTVALRLGQLDPSAPTRYSLTLAAGWLVLSCSLVAFGRIGDRLEERGRSRTIVATLAMPVAAAAAMLLATASGPGLLSVAWILLQLPAGAVIAAALGSSADRAPVDRRGLASGLVGVAPIASVLLGSAVVGVLGAQVALGSALLVLLGIALALPAMLDRRARVRGDRVTGTVAGPHRGSAGIRVLAGAWLVFLVADFLMSWATSTGNGYLVLAIEAFHGASGAIEQTATGTVAIATLTAVVLAVVGGLVSRDARASATAFGLGTLAVAAGLLITVAVPTPAGLAIAAAVFGAGFGLANGAELALAVQLRGGEAGIGGALGMLTAVTSIPYVLAPAAAALLLAGDLAAGLRVLFGLAIVLALGGAALCLRIRSAAREPVVTAA